MAGSHRDNKKTKQKHDVIFNIIYTYIHNKKSKHTIPVVYIPYKKKKIIILIRHERTLLSFFNRCKISSRKVICRWEKKTYTIIKQRIITMYSIHCYARGI